MPEQIATVEVAHTAPTPSASGGHAYPSGDSGEREAAADWARAYRDAIVAPHAGSSPRVRQAAEQLAAMITGWRGAEADALARQHTSQTVNSQDEGTMTRRAIIFAVDLGRGLEVTEDEVYELAQTRKLPFAVSAAQPRRRLFVSAKDSPAWRRAVLVGEG
jgi:hypothetical protein